MRISKDKADRRSTAKLIYPNPEMEALCFSRINLPTISDYVPTVDFFPHSLTSLSTEGIGVFGKKASKLCESAYQPTSNGYFQLKQIIGILIEIEDRCNLQYLREKLNIIIFHLDKTDHDIIKIARELKKEND
jgi:hypothetical protein